MRCKLDIIEHHDYMNDSLNAVRDVFVFQCYTGLSYSDLAKFDFSDVEQDGDNYIIRDVRRKTDEEYFIVILKPAMRSLIAHNFKLPVISNQKYNVALKKISDGAGIDKVITTHVARHTFAVMMLSMGVKMDRLSRMMGHTSTRITEDVYAKVLAVDLKKEYEMVNSKLE